MEEKKMCSNCMYKNVSYNEEPCKSCRNKSNWVNNFKTGDIVTIGYSKEVYVYLRDDLVIRVQDDVTINPPDMRITDPMISPATCKYSIPFAEINILKTNTNDFLKFAWHTIMDRVHYATATEITDHNAFARKDHPFLLSDWIRSKTIREEVNNMEEKKLCRNCKYMYTSCSEEPCKSCWHSYDRPNWKSKKEPEKTPVTKITVHHMGEVRYDKYPTLNANFIKRVIFSDPATIVFWEDGTKTVVKTQDGEKYDKEKGLAMAVAKRVFGNERDYYNVFKRWMRKGEERHEET